MKWVTGLKLFFRGYGRQDPYARYLLAEKLSGFIYPKHKFVDYGRLLFEDEKFIRDYERLVVAGNYHTLDKKFALDQLMQLVVAVPGDTAECGTFRGASSFFICRRIAGTGKQHHVFDSFEGLSAPGPMDGSYWTKGDLTVSEEAARRALSPFDFVVFHRGWIPGIFETVKDRKYCFLHIDVDLYEPTWDSLAFFYEKLSPGALIVGDDYGLTTCPGATAAFDRFFADKPEPLVHLPTGQALIVKR